MSTLVQWVASLCSKDPLRPSLAHPFRCGPWLVGTDGHVLVAVPWMPGYSERQGPDALQLLEPMPPAQFRTTVAALREWAGPSKEDCLICGGVERVRCDSCHGERVRLIAKDGIDRIGFIGNRIVNRRLVALALLSAPEADLVVCCGSSPFGPILLAADGWRMVVMPLRPDADDLAHAKDHIFVGTPVEATT